MLQNLQFSIFIVTKYIMLNYKNKNKETRIQKKWNWNETCGL